MAQPFNFDKAVHALRAGQDLNGKDGILTPLIKQLTEAAMQAELDQHLAQEALPNRKNGSTPKTVKSLSGEFELNTPRDRTGTFEPQLVPKHQTHLTDELERKILSMYALGMSYQDIRQHVNEMYGMRLSRGALTAITDQLIPALEAWQQRPLERVYPIVWLDAIHYNVQENGRVVRKALYTILAMTIDGRKDILGLYLSETEGARYWLKVLTELHNRGVKDILIACVDGLQGFTDAIQSLYPKTEVQLCVVHQIRNAINYVSHKDHKAFMADLRPVYQALTLHAAETALDNLEVQWGDKYPQVIASWRKKWGQLSVFFHYPEDIRRLIYTTNMIESVHRQFRKLTKTKGAFVNANSLLKLLYAGIQNLEKQWLSARPGWSLVLAQLAIHFEGRIDDYLD